MLVIQLVQANLVYSCYRLKYFLVWFENPKMPSVVLGITLPKQARSIFPEAAEYTQVRGMMS